jgi:hypothetical protein
MAWDVSYNAELHIIESSMSGGIKGSELAEHATARIALGLEKGTEKFLIDGSTMVASKSITMQLYAIPDAVFPEEKMPRNSRLAVIEPTAPGSRWIGEFFEDICVNRGWTVQLFSDRDSAIAWLQHDLT